MNPWNRIATPDRVRKGGRRMYRILIFASLVCYGAALFALFDFIVGPDRFAAMIAIAVAYYAGNGLARWAKYIDKTLLH